MESKIKLTKAQLKIVRLLQAGEVIMHDDKYFYISDGYKSHRISWRVWNALTLEDKGIKERHKALVTQQLSYPFNYVLTQKGEELKL